MRIVLLLPILITTLPAVQSRAEIVDRIVAVVDGRVITWSAVLEEANVHAFESGDPPVEALTEQDVKRLIPQMINQQLLAKEKDNSPFSSADARDAIGPLQAVRNKYPSAEENQRVLARYKLTDADVVRHLTLEHSILDFIDYRLRPQVLLSPSSVEAYYENTFLPEVAKQSQAQVPPPNVPSLEDVRGRIEQILTESEINRLLDEWIQQLRSRAKIRILLDSK